MQTNLRGAMLAAALVACRDGRASVANADDAGTTDAGTDAQSRVPVLDAGGPLSSPFRCSAEGLAAAVREGFDVDYAALRTINLNAQPELLGLASSGTECATATNTAACRAALQAASPNGYLWSSFGLGGATGTYLVTTKGDEVRSIGTLAEVRQAAGFVDMPVDVALMLKASGYDIQCGTDWIRADGDGFVVLAEREISDCPWTVRYVVARVSRDGTITILDSKVRVTTICF